MPQPDRKPARPTYVLEFHPTVQPIPLAIYRDKTELVASLTGTACTMEEARTMLAALNAAGAANASA